MPSLDVISKIYIPDNKTLEKIKTAKLVEPTILICDLDNIRFIKYPNTDTVFTCCSCQYPTKYRTMDICLLSLFSKIGLLSSKKWNIINHNSFKFENDDNIYNYFLAICSTECWEQFKKNWGGSLIYATIKDGHVPSKI